MAGSMWIREGLTCGQGRDNNARMGRLVKRFGRVVPGEVLDARAQAELILAASRRQASALIEKARTEAVGLHAEAWRAGEAAGRAEAQSAFTTLAVEARAEAERLRSAAIPAARTLAVRMAEKIVRRTIQLDPSTLADIAAQALAAARAHTGVVLLRVHPEDQAALAAARPVLAARLAAAVELRLVADPAVSRSGCIVETTTGRLDARLETQLTALERAVFGDAVGPAGEARNDCK
jgi:type III secretion protein L